MLKRSYVAFVVLLVALVAAPGAAQSDNSYDLALGVGAGLVDTGSNNAEYFTANFRFRVFGPPADEGIASRGYLEIEAAAWDDDDNVLDAELEEVLFGVNLIGVVPYRAVDFFYGGGVGIHVTDVTFRSKDGRIDDDGDVLGLNFQTGVDFHLTDNLAIFALLRLDLLEDPPSVQQDFEIVDDNQSKVALGLRFNFN